MGQDLYDRWGSLPYPPSSAAVVYLLHEDCDGQELINGVYSTFAKAKAAAVELDELQAREGKELLASGDIDNLGEYGKSVFKVTTLTLNAEPQGMGAGHETIELREHI